MRTDPQNPPSESLTEKTVSPLTPCRKFFPSLIAFAALFLPSWATALVDIANTAPMSFTNGLIAKDMDAAFGLTFRHMQTDNFWEAQNGIAIDFDGLQNLPTAPSPTSYVQFYSTGGDAFNLVSFDVQRFVYSNCLAGTNADLVVTGYFDDTLVASETVVIGLPVEDASYVSKTFTALNNVNKIAFSVTGNTDPCYSFWNIHLTRGNSAPSSANNTVSMNEDTSHTFAAGDFNYSDREANPLSAIKILSVPSGLLYNGSAVTANQVITAGNLGLLTYALSADTYGSANFNFQVYDGALYSSQYTMTMNVLSVNDAPSFTKGANQTVPMNAGAQSISNWATAISPGGGADEAGQALTFTVTNTNNALFSGAPGQPAISAAGTLTYTPATGATGTATVTVTLKDDGGTANGGVDTSASQTFTITVSANNPPVIEGGAASVAVTMSEDGSPTAFSLVLGAVDPEGDTITWSIDTPATNGTATASGNGTSKSIGYTPNGNYNGTDSFVVKATDSFGGSDTITVNVTIAAVNDAPAITEAAPTITMNEDGGTNTSLTLHATDVDTAAGSLTWSISAGASHGTATASGTGSSKTIGYTPDLNYNGSDSFTVQVSDGSLTATRVVNVTVNAVNDPPTFTLVGDQTVNEDAGAQTATGFATITSRGALDESGQTVTFTVTNNNNALFSSQPAISPTGTLTWTPGANKNGSATVTVTAVDNGGTANGGVDTSASQQFTITVNAVNDAPVITEATPSITMNEDGGTNTSLTLHATDVEGDTITWSVTGAAGHGTANINGSSGQVSYTPNADYNGSDSFTVTADDGHGGTAARSVSVTINAVNDAPVITEGIATTVAMSEDSSPTAFALTLHATDIDTASTSLTWSIASGATSGTASVSGTGSAKDITYIPTSNYNGSDSFVVQVSDGAGGIDTITVTVNITAVNDAPIINEASPVAVTMTEDGTPTDFSLTLHATNVDSDTLTWSIATPAGHGTASASGTGLTKAIGYTPNANYNGSDSFVVQVSDGALSASVTVNVTITAVNDAPGFTAGANVTVGNNVGSYSFSNWATGRSAGPADEAGQLLTFHVSNDNNGLFTTQPQISSAGTLTFTPATGTTGVAHVDVYVTDNGGTANGGVDQSGTVTFTITTTVPMVAATPTFSVPAGAYTSAQSVELACATAGATIRYTIDGTDPTPVTGSVYGGAISVPMGATRTIKAIATKTGLDPSPVASATYSVYQGLGLEDGAGHTLPATVTATGGVFRFAATGGSGSFTVVASPNANGAVGTVTLSNGRYTFTAPTTGAFAGSYTILVTDDNTGWTSTLTIEVPLVVELERYQLLTRGDRQTAQVTVTGAAPGDTIALTILDGTGAVDATGSVLTLSAGSAAAANDTPNGNPAVVDATALNRATVANFALRAGATGLPTGTSTAAQVRPAVGYAGTVYGTAAVLVSGAGVRVFDVLDELGEPYAAVTDSKGVFLVLAPDNLPALSLLQVTADGYAAHNVAASGCTEAAPCTISLDPETVTATPTFTPDGGWYRNDVTVTLATTTVGATIRYTTDGSWPSRINGTAVTSGTAVVLRETTTLRAMAYKNGITDSEVKTASFRVGNSGGGSGALGLPALSLLAWFAWRRRTASEKGRRCDFE